MDNNNIEVFEMNVPRRRIYSVKESGEHLENENKSRAGGTIWRAVMATKTRWLG